LRKKLKKGKKGREAASKKGPLKNLEKSDVKVNADGDERKAKLLRSKRKVGG